VRAAFDLDDAAALTGYLADLGADWAYLSPLLVAEPGSDHGYDVIDHTAVDPQRGGPEALSRFAAAARAAGLGVLVDTVPNHVGVATPHLNAWWWDLLRRGRGSEYAEAFDVDWDAADGRIRLPLLYDGAPEPLLDDDELRLGEVRLPLAPGSAEDGAPVDEVLSRQHYELIHWRRADAELNYRRFFAVSTLAAVRVEVPWVFDATHAEILRWLREGLADGLRVDHPDGLADPGGYLDRLAAAAGDRPVYVEKILERGEELPSFWPVDGTTGYDLLADVDRVLVDPCGRTLLEEAAGGREEWEEVAEHGKRQAASTLLRAEVTRLARLAPEIADAGPALVELIVRFPVYRFYPPAGLEHLERAAAETRDDRPDLTAALDALLPRLRDRDDELSVRFAQVSGAVMAKGVEDTAFYRFGRLASLTEVGGDPGEFSIDVEEFHRRQRLRQASLPGGMTALSTHDTKRSEDVRARINATAEVPEEWARALAALRARAPLGDAPLEALLWSSLVGAWPIERDRAHAYAEKAAREAATGTGWADPDAAFEERLHALVDAAYDDEEASGLLAGLVELTRDAGRSNSLAAKLLQLAGPGVPDVYQGSELWEHSLVDPDNRRPVDFAARRALLGRLDSGELPEVGDDGAAKLLVTSRALRARRDRPELFDRYLPLPAFGPASDHLVAFDRGGAIAVATRLPIGLRRRGGWGDTVVLLPPGPHVDAFTGASVAGGETPVGALLSRYPVALLLRS
jgi:(1->4)-alpha-D-glucan 1-alpha-D-glucosylmutase